MKTLQIGIYTESYVLSRGLQYILSRVRGIAIGDLMSSEIDLDSYLSDNNIDLLIVSDTILQNADVMRKYKTSRKLEWGLIRITNAKLNSLLEFKIDFSLNDSEKAIMEEVKRFVEASFEESTSSADGDLSKREIEILKLIALGLTNQDIADKLFISKHTVMTHRKKITAKLGIKTISGLTVYALLNNIIEMGEVDV